jgi:hypothetical protein
MKKFVIRDISLATLLARVEVRGFDTLAPAFKLYWQDTIGKPVSAEDLAKRYEALITTPFAADFAPGSLVDSNGLDQRLEEASFDLPVSLEVTIRSAGPRPTFTSP